MTILKSFAFRKYQNYLLGAEALGITDVGDFWSYKTRNIESLEAEYNEGADKVLH
jgi:hypothetical protein